MLLIDNLRLSTCSQSVSQSVCWPVIRGHPLTSFMCPTWPLAPLKHVRDVGRYAWQWSVQGSLQLCHYARRLGTSCIYWLTAYSHVVVAAVISRRIAFFCIVPRAN